MKHGFQTSLRTRIYWAFRTLNGLMVVVAALGIVALLVVGAAAQQAVETGARMNEIRLDLRAESLVAGRIERDYLLREEGEGVRRLKNSYGKQMRAVASRMELEAREAAALAEGADKGRFEEIAAQATKVAEGFERCLKPGAEDGLKGVRAELDRLERMTFDEAQAGVEQSKAALATVKRATRNTIFAQALLSLAAMAACVYFGTRLAKHITVPVETLTDVAKKVSLGDLSVKVERTSEDEIGELQDSLARLVVAVKFFQVESEEAREVGELV